MRILALKMFVLAIATSCMGCGTFYNLTNSDHHRRGGSTRDYPRIYGGTHWDADKVKDGVAIGFPQISAIGIVDMPFSAVGDTVTLPVVITMQRRNQKLQRDVYHDEVQRTSADAGK